MVILEFSCLSIFIVFFLRDHEPAKGTLCPLVTVCTGSLDNEAGEKNTNVHCGVGGRWNCAISQHCLLSRSFCFRQREKNLNDVTKFTSDLVRNNTSKRRSREYYSWERDLGSCGGREG